MDVASLKVTELRDELKKRGLSTVGLKKELADRLTQCFADAELLSRPIAGLKPEQLVEDEQSKSEDTTEIPNPEIPVSPTETPTTNPPAEITTPTPEPGQAQAEESNIPEQAEKDETVPITDDEVKEQVLGDSNGDLGDAMEDAEKEGKAERKEEQAEEMKQESNTLEEDKTQAVEQDGTKEETDEVKTENTGEKRKRDDEDEKMDIEVEGQAKKARVDEDVEMSSEPKEEQPVSDPFESISNPLEHAQHPPTTALFIDNFKRPVDLVELRELLESHGELDETVIERGIWLSGVKSHLYVAYKTQESATKAALAIHGMSFQPVAKTTLHVEFVPSSLVPSLITEEDAAWKDGRKQMTLVIKTVPVGEGYQGTSRKVEVIDARPPGGMPNGQGRRAPPGPPPFMPARAMPGVSGIGGVAVTGAKGRLGGRGAPIVAGVNATPVGFRVPPNGPIGRDGLQNGPVRETRGFKKTTTRPVIFWREAPGKA